MRFEHGPRFSSNVVDARPLGDEWFVLRRDGLLDLSELDGTPELHVSQDGRFAAVTERHGRHGRVFELSTGRPRMALDRGGYYPETSVFPAAFVQHEGRTLLVHGTDWNRLDVSDPATGTCLTKRGPTAALDIEDIPPHYLNYFHGALYPSPNGRWIADDGWIWHPFGEIRTWSFGAWLANDWESEDGPTVRMLTQRYDWDAPLCWIDDQNVAVWGTANYDVPDDYDEVAVLRPAVRLFDVATGDLRQMLDGPEAMPVPRQDWMVFDQALFLIERSGTSIWTLAGERLHFEPGFAPRRYHPGRQEFLSWNEAEAFVSRLVP